MSLTESTDEQSPNPDNSSEPATENYSVCGCQFDELHLRELIRIATQDFPQSAVKLRTVTGARRKKPVSAHTLDELIERLRQVGPLSSQLRLDRLTIEVAVGGPKLRSVMTVVSKHGVEVTVTALDEDWGSGRARRISELLETTRRRVPVIKGGWKSQSSCGALAGGVIAALIAYGLLRHPQATGVIMILASGLCSGGAFGLLSAYRATTAIRLSPKTNSHWTKAPTLAETILILLAAASLLMGVQGVRTAHHDASASVTQSGTGRP
jgi:hypothetical protein